MANDLQFKNPLGGTPPIDLQFGVDGGPGGPPTYDLVLAATLPAPVGDTQGEVIILAEMQGYVLGPRAAIQGEFDINVDRGPKAERTAVWEVAANGDEDWQDNGWKTPLNNSPVTSTPFQEAAQLGIDRSGSSRVAPRLRTGMTTTFEEGALLTSTRGFVSQQGRRLGTSYDAMRFENGAPLNWFAGSDYQYAAALGRFLTHVNEQGADLATQMDSSFDTLGDRMGWLRSSRYEQAGLPEKGEWGGFPPPVDPENPPPYEPENLDLQFCLDMNLVQHKYLRFGVNHCEIPPQPPTLIPILRIYTVANSAQIVRVSDGMDVPATQVSLSSDVGSFAWEMSAGIVGKDAAALVEGTDAAPVEVDVIINGYTWRVLIDSWSLQQAAVSTTGTISGRSLSAYLSAPYATPRNFTETAQKLMVQLAEQELPVGWTLQWNAVDWLVPANAWSYQNLAPMNAIARLAEAAGGFVSTNRNTQQIIVNPRYPAAPWNWEAQAPAIELPKDVLFQRSSQKTPGTGVNGVWVHGDVGGVLAHVRRNGSAGEILAPNVVDGLITHVDAARERGIGALAATTRQSVERYDMPLASIMGGLRTPGELIAIGEGDAPFVKDFTGLIKSVGITAAAQRSGGGAALTVRQSLSIERYFAEA